MYLQNVSRTLSEKSNTKRLKSTKHKYWGIKKALFLHLRTSEERELNTYNLNLNLKSKTAQLYFTHSQEVNGSPVDTLSPYY